MQLRLKNQKMKQLKYTIVALFCFGMLSIQAQQKLEKISKSINVNKDATIDLNTSHTNIEIETWNKDVLEVEAYIESDKLTKEELQKASTTLFTSSSVPDALAATKACRTATR